MKVETIEESDDKLVLVISKVTPGFVNAVRRSVINEVPVLAIEKVFISKNSSAMYDEILAHRLGLIPLITPSGYSYDKRDAPANQVRVTLKKQGPATVYSGDLVFSDPEVKPVFDNIPIVELLNNQEVELEAVAIMGKGREHAKWSPGIAYHRNYPKIRINRNCKAAVDACPKGVYTFENGQLKADPLKCEFIGNCVEACKGAIKVEPEKNKFILTIESWGNMPARKILDKAIDEVERIFNEFSNGLKSAK